MNNQRYPTGKAPHIVIPRCHGDLVIRGWEDLDVLARGDDCEIEEVDGGLSITSGGRLRLTVPTDTTLSLSQLSGDVVVKNVDGAVELDDVSGDAVLAGVGGVKIGTIHNDLSAKKVAGSVDVEVVHGDVIARSVGSLTAGTVHGDLSGRLVDGDVQLKEVMGDIGLHNVAGDVEITHGRRDANLRSLGGQAVVSDISGDIRIRGSLADGKHTFTASGDIVLRWPEDVPLNLTAEAPKIVNRLQFEEVAETKDSLVGTMNGSAVNLTLKAKGQIVLKSMHIVDEKWEWEEAGEGEFDFGVDLEGLGERISMQVNKQVARISSDLESRFGPEFSQKMAEKIAKRAEWAAAKAERAAEQAMRRAERGMKRASRRAQQQRQQAASQPQKKKATSEEQLKILKMVEQGIITTEEATTLLEALEQ